MTVFLLSPTVAQNAQNPSEPQTPAGRPHNRRGQAALMNHDSDRRPGEQAGAEGGLEVVAADRAIQVQHLAGDIQLRHALATHRPRIAPVTPAPAARYLRLLETKCPRHLDRQIL